MISLLNIPKLPYIIFELVSFSLETDANAPESSSPMPGTPVVVDTVIMDVLPTHLSMKYGSRKSYHMGVGDNNVSVERGGVAPVKISFEGTFGQRMITRGAKVQDGFGRLKEFRSLYLRSQSVAPTLEKNKPNAKRAIYGLNFYDFTIHHWGSVDLDDFEIDRNAQTSNTLPSYSVRLTSMGKLITVPAKDPLLRNLRYAIKLQEKFDEINTMIQDSVIYEAIGEIAADLESLQIANNAVGEMLSTYTSAIGNIPVGLINQTGMTAGSFSGLTGTLGNIGKTIKGFGDLL